MLKKQIQSTFNNLSPFDIYGTCYFQKSAEMTSEDIKNNRPPTGRFLSTTALKSEPGFECLDLKPLTDYLNRDDVKTAIHQPKDIYWQPCNDNIQKNYIHSVNGSIIELSEIIHNGEIRVLIYSGDTDMLVPFGSTEKYLGKLALQVTSTWRKWSAGDNQTSGFITGYTKNSNTRFVTVKGAGHSAPKDKRLETGYIITQFLNNYQG